MVWVNTVAGITVAVNNLASGVSGMPSYKRGIYFDGSTDSFYGFTDIVFAPQVSLHFWMLTFDTSATNEMTIM
ncbi:MAG: hypothetical protein V2I33_21245 [Kangiellaceae bacterium]|jgi:hypothetical protein|nr:hypothetical protein [Kangiellaceae bacterium]